jgi:hypothetical protein
MLFFLISGDYMDAKRSEIKNKSFHQGLNSRPGDLCTILTNCTIDTKFLFTKTLNIMAYK